jgi:hypothetical protein
MRPSNYYTLTCIHPEVPAPLSPGQKTAYDIYDILTSYRTGLHFNTPECQSLGSQPPPEPVLLTQLRSRTLMVLIGETVIGGPC